MAKFYKEFYEQMEQAFCSMKETIAKLEEENEKLKNRSGQWVSQDLYSKLGVENDRLMEVIEEMEEDSKRHKAFSEERTKAVDDLKIEVNLRIKEYEDLKKDLEKSRGGKWVHQDVVDAVREELESLKKKFRFTKVMSFSPALYSAGEEMAALSEQVDELKQINNDHLTEIQKLKLEVDKGKSMISVLPSLGRVTMMGVQPLNSLYQENTQGSQT